MEDEINLILQDFIDDTKDYGALVINSKGEVMNVISIENDNSVAAMSAAILSMCNKFIEDLEKGLLKFMVLRTTEGRVVMYKVNIEKTLIAFTKNDVSIGFLLLNIEQTAVKLQKIII